MRLLKVTSTSIISLLATVSTVYANHRANHTAQYVTDNCVKTDVVPYSSIGPVMGAVFSFVLIFASILVFCYFILGGVQWMTAGGDKQGAQAARDRLTASMVGLLIILSVFGVVKVLEGVFGLNILGVIKLPFSVLSPFTGGKTC